MAIALYAVMPSWQGDRRSGQPPATASPTSPKAETPKASASQAAGQDQEATNLNAPVHGSTTVNVSSRAVRGDSETLDSLRDKEFRQIVTNLTTGESLLVLGEPGSGKSVLANQVRSHFERQGWLVGLLTYNGSQKDSLAEVGSAFEWPILAEADDKGRQKELTAAQLKESHLSQEMSDRLLILDNAQRFPATFRYWLENYLAKGGLLLLLDYKPPAKDIFLKISRIELSAIENSAIRTIMYAEAIELGATIEAGKIAELQQKAGNNPALARRLVRETVLGIDEGLETGDHYQYLDGTPFLVAGLTCLGIIRLVGIGLGDKSLYVIGGIFTVLAIALRVLLYRANRKSSRL